MATSTFTDLLSERSVLVADGAMGTTLFSMGLESGECPEVLNVQRPEIIREVHERFLHAGADIVLTNTFGANARRLTLHGREGDVAELNAAAVARAREAVEASGRRAVVAGSIGPTGDLLEPLGSLPFARAVEVFAQQATALSEAGADVLWIETISSLDELDAAVQACQGLGLPVTATLSFDTAGHTMMGVSGRRLGEWLLSTPHAPLALGANCGIGPGDAVAAVLDITEVAPHAVGITKANCGMPLFETDRLVYPVGPEKMVDYVELSIRSGARIIGACCGSTPDHVAAIRRAVDEWPTGPRPIHGEVEGRLDATPVGAGPARRRRRRD